MIRLLMVILLTFSSSRKFTEKIAHTPLGILDGGAHCHCSLDSGSSNSAEKVFSDCFTHGVTEVNISHTSSWVFPVDLKDIGSACPLS